MQKNIKSLWAGVCVGAAVFMMPQNAEAITVADFYKIENKEIKLNLILDMIEKKSKDLLSDIDEKGSPKSYERNMADIAKARFINEYFLKSENSAGGFGQGIMELSKYLSFAQKNKPDAEVELVFEKFFEQQYKKLASMPFEGIGTSFKPAVPPYLLYWLRDRS